MVHLNVVRYVPEGNMTACGTDYLSKEWLSRSYILIYSVFVYFMPLLLIIYSYFFIVQVPTYHIKFFLDAHCYNYDFMFLELSII